ncbi:SRPBCC family protein [Halobacillus locisalis]|uniref:SRPBCC family protein n=1 Tax=Halobacillus locisalis TaxID=220753 RepID=A0A838CQI9_9BACI|nr:SRPBCC family protein [Halobacillus locisalis]MBA2174327.1 SRPBCC family protein [Halobacillus locisalis]
MISWKEIRKIDSPIETVWKLFLDENIKIIMPKVESHEIIEKNEHEIGAKHRQTYREGKRLETYTVETLDYVNEPHFKRKQQRFVLGKAFEINLIYSLYKQGESQTDFVYEGTNKGVNFIGHAMLKLGNEKSNKKVVDEFMDRVEKEALNTNR